MVVSVLLGGVRGELSDDPPACWRDVGLVRGDRPPYRLRRSQGGLFAYVWGAVPCTALYPTRMYMTNLGFGLCFLLS